LLSDELEKLGRASARARFLGKMKC